MIHVLIRKKKLLTLESLCNMCSHLVSISVCHKPPSEVKKNN